MPGDWVSSLIVAELYDSGDASFLDLIRQPNVDFKPLLGVLERWKKDSRPWARALKFDFLLGSKSPWENRVVFKRLFKQAWVDRDHELMGAFMVVLDRSIRRKRSKRYRFSPGVIEATEVLKVAPGSTGKGFSTATRHYLRRRACRYFRRLGHADPAAYLAAIAGALVRYTDDDMRAGENLLDNWGLMHACFGKSVVLTFNARHTNLSGAGRLADLQAAPMFERHWATPDGAAKLFDVLLAAQSRPVRVWSIQLLRRLHAAMLPTIDGATLLKLLDHVDPDVAAFAADLLSNAQTVSAFPMPTWMQLLATRNPAVVATITQAFRKHVNFERVTIEQAVELATRAAAPVAALGLELLQSRTLSPSQVHQLAGLSAAQCEALGRQIGAFAVSRLNVPRVYQLDEVIAFFDSGRKSVRQGAFDGLGEQSPAASDPALWVRLLESPYDDVRIELVTRLKKRATLGGASATSLASLWQNVLLNIHRGGRAKLSSLRQISDQILRDPQSAKILLPVLTIAIRSVRPPEARHGLAAIVQAVEQVPSLADVVKRQFPELQLDLVEAAR